MRALPWIGSLALAGAAVVTVTGARTEATALVAGWQQEARIAVRDAGEVRVHVAGRTLHVEGVVTDSTRLEAVRTALGNIEGITRLNDRLSVATGTSVPVIPADPSPSSGETTVEAAPSPAPVVTNECEEELEALFRNQVIRFPAFSAALGSENDALLDDVAEIMAKCPETVLEISGHADGQGTTELNDSLSRARAEVVRQRLVDRGIDRARVLAVGRGDREPIGDDATESGRSINRRIEIRLREGR